MLKDDPPLVGIPDIIESSPYMALRFIQDGINWRPCFVSKNIRQLGYTPEEFIDGNLNWLDIVHAEDKATRLKQICDYNQRKINTFKLYYRIITKDFQIIPVTEYRNIYPSPDNELFTYDAFILSNSHNIENQQISNNITLEQSILNDIFISLQDTSPEKSIGLILARAGEYLNVSRVLLFRDAEGCKINELDVEWCNKDIKSFTTLIDDFNCTIDMPDAYTTLQNEGMMLINSGEVPDSCILEFEKEGIHASAIFAVHLNSEYYGFVCFDDCIIERVWEESTMRFLKTISNIISNVLSHHASDRELEKSHKRYVSILDNIEAYIFVTEEQDNNIIFANRAFKKSFGHNCMGKSINNYLSIDITLLSSQNVCYIDKEDYPEIYCPDTKEWLSVIMEKIEWIDSFEATLFTCYDITAKKYFSSTLEQKIEERTSELKRMAQRSQHERRAAEEATKAKSHFLANMSHEIRTPMNAILGLSKLLSEADISKLHIDYAKNIHNSSTILLKIINDILDISKLEANKVILVSDNFSLIKILDHIASLLHSMAESKNLKFLMTTHDDIPECLYGDDIRLRQILINLLSNAVKYTEKGTVELSVDADDSTVTFTVKDTGYGIKEEEIGNIFEPFAQADLQKNRAIQSTGLGLPICRSLANLMKATVTAQSVYGVGSTFILTIPKVLGDPSKLVTDVKSSGKILSAPNARVLVVDDIDINLYVAKALLEIYDIDISTASSGAEALKLVQEEAFDIVFMDHMMPEMDGVATTQAIRKLGGKFIDLIIIALSANAMTHSQELFKKASMQDFISKPIEMDKLQVVLERWLPPSKMVWKKS